MRDIETVVRSYGAAWMDVSEAERRRLLEFAWSEAGLYQDPTAEVAGREALIRHIAVFQERSPNSKLSLTSGAQHHHGQIHFTWAIVGPDGTTILEGRDFGELDRDGRLCRIVGFFGPPPAAGGISSEKEQE
jgi:hypothetical protein